jgi:bacterioferritin-associated ferredoxin
MWICVCHAVTDREVLAAIQAGAETRQAVTAACQAGGDCGSCHHMIEQMIEGVVEAREELVSAEKLVRHRAA